MRSDDKQVGGTHYKDLEIEVWEVLEGILTPEEFRGFLKGCALKHAIRQGRKTPGDGDKARHYIEKLAEVLRHKSDLMNG
jgi:hypothetical protein